MWLVLLLAILGVWSPVAAQFSRPAIIAQASCAAWTRMDAYCRQTGDTPDTLWWYNGTALETVLNLSGGTLTGNLTLSNLGLTGTASDTNPTCAVTDYRIYADLSEGKWKKCQDGVVSDLDTGGVTTPGGSNTQVQYNNGGNFGASPYFTFDATTRTLTLGDATNKASLIVFCDPSVDVCINAAYKESVAPTEGASGQVNWGFNAELLQWFANAGSLRTALTTDQTQTITGKTLDVEASGNTITTVSKVWLPAAACQNTTATLLWDTPTTNPAVAACITGTNTQKGVADFADGSNLSMQQTLLLPSDWTGAIDAKFKWLTTATSGDVVWQLATICVADAETDDPAFNTASTVTDTAKGTTNQTNDASITGVTATGCAAGELMHLKVLRDSAHASDTLAATARLIGVELTLRRAQ